MIKNYIKLAWRVLWRKKFFTFISLFGISFTLATLMIFTSLFQTELSQNAPMGNMNDLVYIPNITLQKQYYDTIPVVDSIQGAMGMVYDTTFTTKEGGRSMSSSDISKQILHTYLSDIPSASHAAFINLSYYDIFVNNSKVHVDAVFTNADYWTIFNFNFIEGRPFDHSEVQGNNPIMVITDNFAKNYFGETRNILNREVIMDGRRYRIIGLVETPKISQGMGYSVSRDVFIPYSLLPEGYHEDFYFGGFHAVYLTKPNQSISTVTDDLLYAAKQIPIDHPDNSDEYEELVIRPATLHASFAQELYYDEDAYVSLTIMTVILISLLSLFILLPMLNLINLNVSRIMDRASEIGVRKAFGADKMTILSQFVFENIVLTLIGGFLALILAAAGLILINQSKVLGNTFLSFDTKFFVASLFICLIFGILSGIIPALKMAKLNIVDALKQNQL
jgi:putative ABC transport system permease protein